MGAIADRVRQMRGLSLSAIADEVERMEAEALDVGQDEFVRFWSVWPNRVGKPDAQKAYRAARKKGHRQDAILAGVETYIRTKPADRPWLNPGTYLRQERWNDQPAEMQPKTAADMFGQIAEYYDERSRGSGTQQASQETVRIVHQHETRRPSRDG